MNRKSKIISEICRAKNLTELKDICNNYEELYGKLDNYLTDDETLEYIKNSCDSMQRLYYTITDITNYDTEYFYLDNYGNLSNIDESLDDIKHDLINEL